MNAIRSAASSQPVQALQLANRVRRARSMLKARIANGHLAAAEINPDAPIGGHQRASCPAIGESARLGRDAVCRKNGCCQACEEPMPVDELRTKVYFANTDHPLVFQLCPACVEVGGVTVTWTHAHPDPE